MVFKKGESGNPGGKSKAISPVTLKFCSEHYEKALALLASTGNWESVETYFNSLMKLLQFEHAELFGKPKEQIKAEISGGMTFTVKIQGRDGESTVSLPLHSGQDN